MRRRPTRARGVIVNPSRRKDTPRDRCIAHRAIVRVVETYLLPCGRQTIMDLALDTLPVETATVLATCAEAWVMADMVPCVWISADRARGRPPLDGRHPRVRINIF